MKKIIVDFIGFFFLYSMGYWIGYRTALKKPIIVFKFPWRISIKFYRKEAS